MRSPPQGTISMEQVGATTADRGSADLRRMMVDNQIRTFDVTDQRVLEVFYLLPRETSLPPSLAPLAYSDAQIRLPSSQEGRDARVLLPPMFLAKLIQGATVSAGQRVLVVAGASGYAAALLAEITGSVVSLESDPALTAMATRYLDGLGLGSVVRCVTGPLNEGHAAEAPYDVILVQGAVEQYHQALFGQLAPGGCLVCVEAKGPGATRRTGKAMRFDLIRGEISGRALFDATVPIIEEFRERPSFVF